MLKKYIVLILLLALAGGGLWWMIASQNNESATFLDRNNTANTETPGITSTQSSDNLPEAKSFESVLLKDNDVFDMTIAPVKKEINGQWITMLGYNGSVPGPALTISQGATITIRLTNHSDVPTTLHSHGVRVENAFDGVPGLTQKAINPGETFEYKLNFPDAGAYWYHPHVRTDYTLESGLYGSYIVMPNDAAYWASVNREVPIMLDDIAIDKNGIIPFSKDTTDHVLMGRFGNVMFTNGETAFTPNAKRGEVVRLYFTNAANTRVFNIAIPGAKMKLVGADLGRYAKETFVDEVMLGPGERRIVDVLFEKSDTYKLIHKTPKKQYTLETITVTNEDVNTNYAQAFNTLRNNDSVAAEMESLQQAFNAKTPDKKINLELSLNGGGKNMMGNDKTGAMGGGHMMDNGHMMSNDDMGMGDDGEIIEWEDTMSTMNQQSNSDMMTWEIVDTATGKVNMDIADWNFKIGDKVKVQIFNNPRSMHPMQHPIHFHGQKFIVLDTNGVKNTNPVWQDTALILKGDTVNILIDMSNPGKWMAHCHILEHAESGMMMPFSVEK